MQSCRFGSGKDWKDVTHHILSFQDEKQPFTISTKLFGDPAPGILKHLECKSNHGTMLVLEHSSISFPDLLYGVTGDAGNILTANDVWVTFIIPSIGRPTLIKSIESLLHMKSKQWNALIVFDGKDITLPKSVPDPFEVLSIDKKGFANCAGEVRNVGMHHMCATSSTLSKNKWFAFLDDDDIVTPDYMYRLEQEVQLHPHADVIVFRMLLNNRVLPQKQTLIRGEIGISFAMKQEVFSKHGMCFEASREEDFELLQRIEKRGLHIHFSDFITYLVQRQT
jgi:hypothetical protein